jgi:hypothetical protein
MESNALLVRLENLRRTEPIVFSPGKEMEEFDHLLALARRGAAVQWRPIEEAPKDGKEVLSIFVDLVGPYYSLVSWSDSYGWVGENGIVNPTHFMPLPPPPEKEKLE